MFCPIFHLLSYYTPTTNSSQSLQENSFRYEFPPCQTHLEIYELFPQTLLPNLSLGVLDPSTPIWTTYSLDCCPGGTLELAITLLPRSYAFLFMFTLLFCLSPCFDGTHPLVAA